MGDITPLQGRAQPRGPGWGTATSGRNDSVTITWVMLLAPCTRPWQLSRDACGCEPGALQSWERRAAVTQSPPKAGRAGQTCSAPPGRGCCPWGSAGSASPGQATGTHWGGLRAAWRVPAPDLLHGSAGAAPGFKITHPVTSCGDLLPPCDAVPARAGSKGARCCKDAMHTELRSSHEAGPSAHLCHPG